MTRAHGSPLNETEVGKLARRAAMLQEHVVADLSRAETLVEIERAALLGLPFDIPRLDRGSFLRRSDFQLLGSCLAESQFVSKRISNLHHPRVPGRCFDGWSIIGVVLRCEFPLELLDPCHADEYG